MSSLNLASLTKHRLQELYWGEPQLSAHQIAQMCECNHTSIVYRLRKYSITIRPVHSGKTTPVVIDAVQLRAMYEGGMTLQQIAAKIQVGWELVRKYLRRSGVTMRPKHHIAPETCIETGCSLPVHKVWHNVWKKFYGTRCVYHRKRHYALMNRYYMRRKKNIPPEYYKLWECKYIDGRERTVSYQTPRFTVLPLWTKPEFTVTTLRCRIKACPYPAADSQLCKKHLVESKWEASHSGGSSLKYAIDHF